MAEEAFRVFKWKIENFCCWCETLHDKCIQSPLFFEVVTVFDHVELFPKGCSGQDDDMVVRFCDVKSNFIGDLAFICSDGSSICSQQLEITQSGDRVPGTFVNLKFEQVVARIRKERDEITLRFRIQSFKNYEQRMCTTIRVRKVSYQIDLKSVESVKSDESKEFSYVRYSSKKGEAICLNLARQKERVQLTMKPKTLKDGKAVLVESSLSMLSSNNDLVRKEEAKHVFFNGEAWIISESLTVKDFKDMGINILWGLKFINGEIVERYNYCIEDEYFRIVPNGRTIGICEQKSYKSGISSNQSDDSVTDLSKDLMCLYQDQDLTDFHLKCESVSFPVHKAILSARSPVFKTMLSTDMTEAASGQVVIEDLDPSTLSLFLIYLYTGAVEGLQWDRALKLYYAADKYQVPSLKRECSDFLCDKMSVENVCDVLTLAENHKDEGLTSLTRYFVLNNYNDVLESKNWENFMESEPMLALKTVTYFAKKKYVGKLHDPLEL